MHRLAGFEKKFRVAPIVASIRDPLDSISSSIQRYGLEPTDDVISDHIREYEKQGMWQLYEIWGKKNVLVLRYEDFAFDFDHMFAELEAFFKVAIPNQLKKRVVEEFSIDRVKQKAESRGEFANYDKEDQIHGQHISKFSGASGYYREFLSEQQIEHVYEHFKKIFVAFDYEI